MRKRNLKYEEQIEHVGRLIGVGKSRIYRIGVELEGGFAHQPTYKGKAVGVAHDGSVFKDKVQGVQVKPAGCALLGEVASKPMFPIELSSFIRACFPLAVNETCGLHVHMSFFSPRHYSRLMDSRLLQDSVKHHLAQFGKEEGLEKAHPLWDRLAGKSEYCTDKFWPDMQAVCARDHDRERAGNRYTMMHYGWAINETIECRVLPMFKTPDQSIRAVQRVLDITNAVLAVTAEREPKLVSEVVVKDAGIERLGWKVRL